MLDCLIYIQEYPRSIAYLARFKNFIFRIWIFWWSIEYLLGVSKSISTFIEVSELCCGHTISKINIDVAIWSNILHWCQYGNFPCWLIVLICNAFEYTDVSLSPQTYTHVCLITDFCPGGELFAVLDKQPMKIFKEESARYSHVCIHISVPEQLVALLFFLKFTI